MGGWGDPVFYVPARKVILEKKKVFHVIRSGQKDKVTVPLTKKKILDKGYMNFKQCKTFVKLEEKNHVYSNSISSLLEKKRLF